MNKYPIGPKTIEKASKTEAGKLAGLLNRVLYSADNAEVMIKTHSNNFDTKADRYVCQQRVFKGNDLMPSSVTCPPHSDGKYFETEKLMLAIRDYLEATAIREVCE
jgi:hypothetical protein